MRGRPVVPEKPKPSVSKPLFKDTATVNSNASDSTSVEEDKNDSVAETVTANENNIKENELKNSEKKSEKTVSDETKKSQKEMDTSRTRGNKEEACV